MPAFWGDISAVFNGFPVVDENNKLIGLITQYDLVSKQGAIHFPTLQKVLQSLPVFNKDRKEYSDDIQKVTNMTAKDIMS